MCKNKSFFAANTISFKPLRMSYSKHELKNYKPVAMLYESFNIVSCTCNSLVTVWKIELGAKLLVTVSVIRSQFF